MTSISDMSPDHAQEPESLLEATHRLTIEVTHLTDRLDVSTRQTRTTRTLSVVVAIIVFVGGTIGAVQWGRVTHALDGNTANAIQLCENSNDARAANLELWTTVLGSIHPTDSQGATQLASLLTWIALLYQPHDCNDLGRVYCVPPPPSLNGQPPAATKSDRCPAK